MDTIFALIGFTLLLSCEKKTLIWVGFFIGILWFYWISFSFRFYDLTYAIPFVIILFGAIYALFFWVISKLGITPEIRALLLFGFSFFSPFGFDWFRPELILINSYFSTDIYLYALFLATLTLLVRVKAWWKLLPITILLALTLQNRPLHVNPPNLNIAIPITDLNQANKWEQKNQNQIIENNFFLIKEAIKAKKDLIILHECAFPLYLDQSPYLLKRLKNLSKDIAIVTGALQLKKAQAYNSSYLFKNGTFTIANKVVLVPFGEKTPLPKWMVDIINHIFFDDAQDYKSAKKVSKFNIKGYDFSAAICYEATSNQLYKNNPKLMIAITNNSWFTPSTEPTLQHLLLKLQAKKHNTIIYHSANSGISGVIFP